MFFRLDRELLERFPGYCVGVVVAEGPAAGGLSDGGATFQLLEEAAAELVERMGPGALRADPAIAAWREAFQAVGINPNRFPASIEALASRVLKGGKLPSVNPAVDLANAAALRFLLPLGCHDLEPMVGDLEVRFSREGDRFTPLGESETELVPPGEPVYADAAEVRTRRWIWRQGDRAKVTPASRRLFFPIDGFYGPTDQAVHLAQKWLAEQVPRILGARVTVVGWVDSANPSLEIVPS